MLAKGGHIIRNEISILALRMDSFSIGNAFHSVRFIAQSESI